LRHERYHNKNDSCHMTVDVLIFDEATSSIDQYSESIIHDAVNAIGRDKTIIVVTHRESSIELCDRIISLN
jgi:ABC-type multidrug transport system fused ATPase/permease subunit